MKFFERSPNRVFIIAEAGVNHDGDAGRAHHLVDLAAGCGADAVKFQTYSTEELVSGDTPLAPYQQRGTPLGSQRELLRALELPRRVHLELRQRCDALGIEFLSSPFDLDSARFLAQEVGVRWLKVASGELTNGPFLLGLTRLGLPLIVSTGMANMDEVREALVVLSHGFSGGRGSPDVHAPWSEDIASALAGKVCLLHCTTEYPAPPEDANLRAMDALKDTFGLSVGLSDHSQGIVIALAAVARGAVVLEKHLTVDRCLQGPDHAASLDPDEFRTMVAEVRNVERALGDGRKVPARSEAANISAARRGLYTVRAIAAGEGISEDALVAKRPASGLAPMRIWSIVGRRTKRDLHAGEPITDNVLVPAPGEADVPC